jgi:hypothetical protein
MRNSLALALWLVALAAALCYGACTAPDFHQMIEGEVGAYQSCAGPGLDGYFVPDGYALSVEYMSHEECPEYIVYELVPQCVESMEETHCEWEEDVLPLSLTVYYSCYFPCPTCEPTACLMDTWDFSDELQGGWVEAGGCE